MNTTPTGDLAVLDQATRRLSLFGADGTLRGSRSLLRLGGAPESFCALSNGRLLFSLNASDSLVELLPNGEAGRKVPRANPVNDPRGVLGQVLLVSDMEGKRCASLLFLGIGFSSIAVDGPARAHPYIERMELPRWLFSSSGSDSLSSDLLAAVDAVVRNDTLWVLFEGHTDSQRRLLDAYELPTGRYLSTVLLPTRASKFALSGDLIVLEAGQQDGTFALLAVKRVPGTGRQESTR